MPCEAWCGLVSSGSATIVIASSGPAVSRPHMGSGGGGGFSEASPESQWLVAFPAQHAITFDLFAEAPVSGIRTAANDKTTTAAKKRLAILNDRKRFCVEPGFIGLLIAPEGPPNSPICRALSPRDRDVYSNPRSKCLQLEPVDGSLTIGFLTSFILHFRHVPRDFEVTSSCIGQT